MLAKGTKRKYSEVDGVMSSSPDPVLAVACPNSLPAVQSHCLMNISLVKLHRSLRHVEPDLRHLVLVANTLRRLQDNIQGESYSSVWKNSEEFTRKEFPEAVSTDSKKPALENMDDVLLSSMDASLYSSISNILDDLNSFEGLSSLPASKIEDDQLCSPKANTNSAVTGEIGKLTSPANILSSSPYLVEDNFEDIFEDIDTSMYDSDPWSNCNMLKTFSNVDEIGEKDGHNDMLELSEWDFLMDVFGGNP
ncbi:hypothetical protein GDO86_015730 [Hymenochirus boettgeri]|uniref:SERTA domain-containing protein n=1 Tax=Hymenochirus boettgeri TaxID=247094 RepID=A0A8T2JZ57_9PIPI|nr:hypothetical protein GDO86_015730 [Hymenochirus boettgeri]